MWSDESSCKKDGYMNMHNLHSWQLENPRLIREDRSQQQFKINGYNKRANNWPIRTPRNVECREIFVFLTKRSTSTVGPSWPWTARRDVAAERCPAQDLISLWPPRSPDLNPLDFFYWGCLKEKVYKEQIINIEQLRQRINTAAEEIIARGFTRRLRRSFIRRCRASIAANGAHFEHLF